MASYARCIVPFGRRTVETTFHSPIFQKGARAYLSLPLQTRWHVCCVLSKGLQWTSDVFHQRRSLQTLEDWVQSNMPPKGGGKRRIFCTIEDIDMVKQVCTVNFGRLKRANVSLSDLRPVSAKAQIHNM